MTVEELKRTVEPVYMGKLDVEIEKQDDRKIISIEQKRKKNLGFQSMLDTEIEKLQS